MRNRLVAVTAAVLLVASAASAGDVKLETEDQKTIYAIGLALSRNLSSFNLTKSELEMVKAGLEDGVLNRENRVDLQVYAKKIQELANARSAEEAEAEEKKAEAFLANAAKEKGAKKLESGLIYQEIKEGRGEQPKATDRVKVHYHGTLTDGTVFDSSVERGQPVTFPLNGVIKCWTEALQLMKVGGKAKLICPSDIAYGDRGSPPEIKPGAALVFEVELLDIIHAPTPKLVGRAEEYRSLVGVDCQATGREFRWDADQYMNGEGVELSCEGHPVDLLDGTIAKGWLATKQFGKIRLKHSAAFGMDILVTPQQNEQMRKAFEK